jgi:hypothetical protein
MACGSFQLDEVECIKIKLQLGEDAIRVTSGPMGKETIHFEAPGPAKVAIEMNTFFRVV